MTSSSRQLFGELRLLNHRLYHLYEQAEAYVAELHDLLAQFARLEHGGHVAILGEVVYQEPYRPEERRDDSALFHQAVLLLPEGFGVLVWDLEEFLLAQNDPHPTAEVRAHFVPFAQSSKVVCCRRCGRWSKRWVVSWARRGLRDR